MERDLISVVVPAYNPHPKSFIPTIDSIFAQTYKPVEVILVDDGSNPPIRKWFTQLKQSQDITLLEQDNKGAPSARNKGFQHAQGEYVIFWDADLVAELEFLSKLYQALQDNPEAAYAYCSFYFGIKKMPGQPFSAEVLRERNYIMTSSLIRSKNFPGFDESLKRFQDWDLWLQLLKQGKRGVFVNEFLFRAEPQKHGMSSWLPSFAYKAPWKWLPGIRRRVRRFEEARKVIVKKYELSTNYE